MAEKDKSAKQGILFDGKPIFYNLSRGLGQEGQYKVTEMYDHQGLSYFSIEGPGSDVQNTQRVAEEFDPLKVEIQEMFDKYARSGDRVLRNNSRRLTRPPQRHIPFGSE